MGINLPEITNTVTGTTQACFEPSLDYVVTKVPRWDLGKFEGVSKHIGTAMKSVGEVMAIGRTWEESIQKALRMVDPNVKGFEQLNYNKKLSRDEIISEFQKPTDKRIFAIAQCLETGEMSPEEITKYSNIDPWFIARLKQISDYRKETLNLPLAKIDAGLMRKAKQLGTHALT
jgi:hypothetical protein